MGFMNPYVGLKRDDTGYYLDYDEASSSPYYKDDQGRSAALSAANRGGRVDMSSFDPLAHVPPVPMPGIQGLVPEFSKEVSRAIIEGKFKDSAFGRADQQYATDQEVARIAQEGRDRIKQAQLSSEIGYAQDAARRASEDQQRSGTAPGGPDVRLTTGDRDTDSVDDEGGGGSARRRRAAYQGSGLKI